MNSSGIFSDARLTALSSVYISFLSLSLIGSCSVIVVSIVKRQSLNEQAKPLFQLALADFLASFVLILTATINFLSYESLPQSEMLCNHGLPLSLAFYSISFLLVIIYALESVHTAQGWRDQVDYAQGNRRIINVLYGLVWLLPLIGYVIYIRTLSLTFVPFLPSNDLIDKENTWTDLRFCNSCILFLHLHIDTNFCSTVDLKHNNFIRVLTFVSVLFVLICCTVVYWKLQMWYRRYEQAGVRYADKVWSSARYMILVIIFCWTPALILISLSFALFETDRLFPLFIIQAASVSLQGFLNSIVYGWRRRNFREAVLGERLVLLAYANQAFFDQSLYVDKGTR